MTLCKYGCGEEITWIDGKPYSLQNHYKVCRPAGKKPVVHVGKKSIVTEDEAASFDAAVEKAMEQGGAVK